MAVAVPSVLTGHPDDPPDELRLVVGYARLPALRRRDREPFQRQARRRARSHDGKNTATAMVSCNPHELVTDCSGAQRMVGNQAGRAGVSSLSRAHNRSQRYLTRILGSAAAISASQAASRFLRSAMMSGCLRYRSFRSPGSLRRSKSSSTLPSFRYFQLPCRTAFCCRAGRSIRQKKG